MSSADNTNQTPAAAVDSPIESAAEKIPAWTSGSLKKRLLILSAASLVVFLATLVMVWFFGRWDDDTSVAAPVVPATERFAQQCELMREQQVEILHVADYEVTDAMIANIAEMDWLETVILDRGVITDEGIEAIAKLPKLHHLRLRLSPVTNQGLQRIADCQSLWYLNLPHADCTSEGIASLQKLKNLRQLRLGSNQLANDVTYQIANLTGLRGIHLIGVPVTDEGLETLAAMPYLESLYLDDAAVTEAGWERLFRGHPDLHVHVNQKHHDRDPKGHPHHD